jgi:hypothetical protein
MWDLYNTGEIDQEHKVIRHIYNLEMLQNFITTFIPFDQFHLLLIQVLSTTNLLTHDVNETELCHDFRNMAT